MIASPLDELTLSAIRDAMSAARNGRIPDAVMIGERALASGGNRAALSAMLGTLHCQTGDLQAGIRHLKAARESKPDDRIIAANLATALSQTGDAAAALEVLTPDVANDDASLQLKRLRAFLAQETEQFSIAISTYEEIVAAVPTDWESWNNLGNARRLAGDAEGSVEALQKAVDLVPDSPPVRLNFGMALAGAGRVDEAINHFTRMAADFPEDTQALRELHAIHRELSRDEEALSAIESASNRSPRDTEILLALAAQRLSLLQTEAAEEAYRRVVELEPGHSLGNLGLAIVFELTNRAEDLRKLVEDADERGVGENALNFIKAFDHRRAKRFAEGLAALEKVPDDMETPRRCHLLGQLKEGVGEHDAAFGAFERMNEIQRDDSTQPEARAANYRSTVRKMFDTVSQSWFDSWEAENPAYDGPSPAFLVGFPRSGTTLLDTMLMGHPLVEVLEEEPTLHHAGRVLPFDEIPQASSGKIQEARAEYFRVAKLHVPLTPGKLLVDKNPLSLNAVPLIKRLFPNAKIILALRHPCDVLLSCYITNFKLNDGMSNFLHLDTAAELYDLSFSYFEKSSELVGLPVHRVIYENVVGDRETELRALLDFLELDWSDEVLDHEATAMNRGRIKTASYSQVAEPIYNRAAGRWQNYRKHLEPVIPVLEPWIARFGYSL